MPVVCRCRTLILLPAVLLCAVGPASAQDLPSAEVLLGQYKPSQKVECDTPTGQEVAQCRVEVEQKTATQLASIVVKGPAGQILRRFSDIDGDLAPDLYRYYFMGLEVFRDIDTDKDGKPNEMRWMNWGGTRWGIDRNEDGRIDEWKQISAHEAARVAVEAMIAGDAALLGTVMLAPADVAALKLDTGLAETLRKSVGRPESQMQEALRGARAINSRTEWVRFDPPVLSLIPAEEGKSAADLYVYENAMAYVRNGEQHELISIGEMVQLGNSWKLVSVPRPLESGSVELQVGGILMQPRLSSGIVDPTGEAVSPQLAALMKELQQVDEGDGARSTTREGLARYSRERADIIEKIIPLAPTAEERRTWITQYAEGLAAAVYPGYYKEALARLQQLEKQVASDQKILGFVRWRRMMAEYQVRLDTEDDDEREKAQQWWLAELERFCSDWKNSPEAQEPMDQLATALEFSGRIDDAERWYTELARAYPRTNGGIKARGALRRLKLTGQKLELSGRSLRGEQLNISQYRGKVVLVVFWASWSDLYVQSLPLLKAVHDRYRGEGFEILGVNLDPNADAVATFIQRSGGNWQHIRDAGGVDGPLAREFGLATVPTMMLVNREGVVLQTGISGAGLEADVKAALEGRSAARESAGAGRPRQ